MSPSPDQTDPRQPPDSLFAVLTLVTLVQALATFTVLALPSVAPSAALTFGLPAQALGYQISLLYLAGAILSGFAGTLVRRHGAATVSLAAVGCGIVGLLGLASGSIPVTILATLLLGAGYGVTNPAASHMLVKVTPDARRNVIFAIKQAGVPLGGMVAALILPGLSERIGWQAAIASSTLLFLIVLVPLLTRRARWDNDREPSAAMAGSALAGVQTVLANPTLIALSVTGFCYAGYQFTLLAFAVTLLVAELGWSLVAAGFAVSLMQVAGIGGRIAWSVLADWSGRGLAVLALIGIATVALGAVMAILSPTWSALAVTAFLFILSFCAVGWNGVYMGEAARVSGPGKAGLATGGMLAFNFSGVIVCPALYALASKATGTYAITFAWFSLLPLIGILAMVLAIRNERRIVA